MKKKKIQLIKKNLIFLFPYTISWIRKQMGQISEMEKFLNHQCEDEKCHLWHTSRVPQLRAS